MGESKRAVILKLLWPNGATASQLERVFVGMNPHAPRQVIGELYTNGYEPYISVGKMHLKNEPILKGGKVGSEGRHIWKSTPENRARGQQLWDELLKQSS